MIATRVGRFLDDRLRIAVAVRRSVTKVFPDHWSFMLGEIALYSFLVLVATGVYLTLFFEPSTAERVYHGAFVPLHGSRTSAAYASTVELSWDVPAGLLIRQTHHWAALIFIGAIVVHLLRIFFTGAFRKPRDVNWVVGLTMLLLALVNGFAGYSLPDDLLSGTGLRIASAIMLSIPVVGSWVQFLVFGGEFPGHHFVERLYIGHVLLVPGLIAALVALHMVILIRQKHSQFPGPGRTEYNVVGSKLWPTYAFRSLALLCAVAAVEVALGGLAQINPVWVWGPFRPAAVTTPAQPDWYLGWVEGALRLLPSWSEFSVFGFLVPAVFVPGVVLPAVTFLVLYAWPWLERRVGGDRERHQLLDPPRDHPVRMAIGVWAIGFYGLLLVGASDDIVARALGVPVFSVVTALRVIVLVLPPILAAIAYVLARALRDSGAADLGSLEVRQLRAAFARGSRQETERSEDPDAG